MKLLARLCLAMVLAAGCAAATNDPSAARGASAVKVAVDHQRKVALVIGVAAYAKSPLANPLRDARSMAQTLRGLGFDVTVVEDGSRTDIVKGVQQFRERLPGAGVALFYFAGHGMQIDGQNYLVPRDVDLGSEDEIKYNTLRLDDVLRTLDSGAAQAKLVILDACRNDPFQRARGGGGGSGLAPVSNAPQGTLVAYATAPGRVALDGAEGGNGLYTSRLMRALATPGLSIEDVFKQTRLEVAQASRGQQVPWESTSLTGRLVLREAAGPDSAVASAAPSSLHAALATGPRPAPLSRGAAPVAGQTFADCDTCPEMVVVAPGRFRMGSPPSEAGRHVREGPQQEVQIDRAFGVARFEVSMAEWTACLLDSSRPGDTARQHCTVWPSAAGAWQGDMPVVGVSWEDAQAYVRWLSRRTGRAYRLLSEAEWEYVARAGSTGSRPWGDPLEAGQAQCHGCSAAKPALPRARSATPAQPGVPANLLGNVWEWVEDCRTPDLSAQPRNAQPQRDGNCAERAIRGGAWLTEAKGLRSAARSFLPVSRRAAHVGFRVAVSLEEPGAPTP